MQFKLRALVPIVAALGCAGQANALTYVFDATYTVPNDKVSFTLQRGVSVRFETSAATGTIGIADLTSFSAYQGLDGRPTSQVTLSLSALKSFSATLENNAVTDYAFLGGNASGYSINFSKAQEPAALAAVKANAAAAALPEPSTWVIMLLGFGVVGYGLRRRTSLLPLSR